jgi:regulator of sigma E protease
MLMPTLLGLIALPLDNIGKIAVFLVALSVLIVLHEAGHFLVARRNGVRVNDFAIGFGPTLLKWTSPRSGTNYRVNLLPLGGYCAMQGEDGKTSEAEQQRQFRTGERPDSDNFQAKTPWQRLAIVVAGPLANFILAFAILFVGAVAFGVASPDSWSTKIGPVNPNTPASRAGLKFGDEIVAIDGVAYDDGAAVVKKIRTSPGVPLELTYARHGTRHTVRVVPSSAKDGTTTIGRIGFVRVPNYVRVGPLDAIKLAGLGVWTGIGDNFSGIAALIKNPIERSQGLSGVIGMERAASEVQDFGWGPYLQLVAMISIALGVFNLLPIPALDGGRGIFIIAEMLRGRPVDAEKEALVHFTGFAVLMALMVFVAYHDIANIVAGKGVF